MRYAKVYDDSKTPMMFSCIRRAMDVLLARQNLKLLSKYEWGTDRINIGLAKSFFDSYLNQMHLFTDSKSLEHAHGIGNNNRWEVYYDSGDEHQVCGYLSLIDDMYGGAYFNIQNLDEHALLRAELYPRGVSGLEIYFGEEGGRRE